MNNGNETGNGLFNMDAIYNSEYFEAKIILYPAAIICVSFLGFDAVTTLSEETKNPKRDIPRAIVLVCLGAGLVFTVIAYLTQVVWPVGWENFADKDTAVFEMLARILIWRSLLLTMSEASPARLQDRRRLSEFYTIWAEIIYCRKQFSEE